MKTAYVFDYSIKLVRKPEGTILILPVTGSGKCLFHPRQGLAFLGLVSAKGAKALVTALEKVGLLHKLVKLFLQPVGQETVKRACPSSRSGMIRSMIPKSGRPGL